MLIQPAFVAADTATAVSYLQAQTQDAWITQALAATGQTDIATSHLASVSGTLVTDYAKTILALAAAGQDPATFGNVDYIAQLKGYSLNNQMGSETLLNDDVWSILALASVGQVTATESVNAKSFLLANQNSDGGFSYGVGGSSDTNDTAAAIMALIEAGVGATDSTVTNALTYLQSAQNDDGGFGYTPGSTSDSGSDAWVISAIYKAGQNPSSWTKGGNNPLTHLQSLQDVDGGFWWVEPGTSDFNNKAMTAFAVIALAGKSYPVGYYQAQPPTDPEAGAYHLRIEGAAGTICDTQVIGTTALDLVKNAATTCGYVYTVQDSAFGQYLSAVAGESAQGMSGWLYFVDYVSPVVGAADYILKTGDDVLWYYGEWGFNPTRLTLDKTDINPGEAISASIQYFNGSEWLPLPNATLQVGSETRTADASGHLNLNIVNAGIYQIYVQTSGFVRSQKINVTVGDTVSRNVGLQVEVDQSGGGVIGGEAIALVVDQTQINFGKLKPGLTASSTVSLRNGGTVALNVGSTVTGDTVFNQGIQINNSAWQDYSDSLTPSQTKAAAVSLTVPIGYLASGVKTGELIFWAASQ